MSLDATVRARIDSKVKEEAEAIFNELGLSMSQAITLFLNRVRYEKGLPFDLRLPPSTSREERRTARMKTMQVVKTSLHDNTGALHMNLSPKEAWETVTRISKESWMLETGETAPFRLDKNKIRIIRKGAHVSDT